MSTRNRRLWRPSRLDAAFVLILIQVVLIGLIVRHAASRSWWAVAIDVGLIVVIKFLPFRR